MVIRARTTVGIVIISRAIYRSLTFVDIDVYRVGQQASLRFIDV